MAIDLVGEMGFQGYVEDMISNGSTDLFPELRPESPAETFGNVFYKPWKVALDQQLADAAERKTFHSFRHRFITLPRHNTSIDKAWVKYLVGHRHQEVTDARYRDPTPLHQLQEAIEAICVIF